MKPPNCARCGHSPDVHSHDDADNHEATDPDCPFRCNECDCPNYVTKEMLFQLMPDVRVGNSDGSEMQWKCTDNVWRWKHVADDGTVLAEGEGAP